MTPMDDWTLLSEPNRRRILQQVWSQELSAGQIAARFDVTFGAVSQHLAKLREAGVVRVRRQGRRRLYRANRERLGPWAAALEQMWAASLDALRQRAEDEEHSGRKLTQQENARCRSARKSSSS